MDDINTHKSKKHDHENVMDTTWIEDFNNYAGFYKDTITNISLFIYYINGSNEIFNIHKENTLLDNKSVLSQEKLVFLLKHFSTNNKKKYKLDYILKYNPCYDNDDIIKCDINTENDKYFHEIQSLNDIKWNDCVDIFKDLNELHIFYRMKNNRVDNSNANKGEIDNRDNGHYKMLKKTHFNNTIKNVKLYIPNKKGGNKGKKCKTRKALF
jgi:hypothetical protein